MSLLDRERIQLITLQQKIGPALKRFETELAKILTDSQGLTRQICDHILEGRSKRFRPTLLLLSADDGRRIDAQAITAAACVELVHSATLVHDDFIDAALIRRGLPSINDKWGAAAALIMGDYLYSKALDVLCRQDLHVAVRLLARTTVLMSEAEMLQLELKYDARISEEQYTEIIYRKTASLIETSCRIGASFNAGLTGLEENFGRFGSQIGLVFQITDDIFDYLGDERRLGKPTGRDWEEGRITLPLIVALRQAPPPTRRQILALAAERDGKGRSESWPLIKSFVTEHGGVEYAYSRARQFGEEAKQALAPVASGIQKDLLTVAVEYVINRLH
jgi:octaprenyl-diphosphate synthase